MVGYKSWRIWYKGLPSRENKSYCGNWLPAVAVNPQLMEFCQGPQRSSSLVSNGSWTSVSLVCPAVLHVCKVTLHHWKCVRRAMTKQPTIKHLACPVLRRLYIPVMSFSAGALIAAGSYGRVYAGEQAATCPQLTSQDAWMFLQCVQLATAVRPALTMLCATRALAHVHWDVEPGQ